MRIRTALAVLSVLSISVACAPEDDSGDADEPVASDTTSESTSDEPSPSDEPAVLSAECADPTQLPVMKEGFLTIATDSPAYEPWFVDNDPTNGQGYEAAVAYSVAGTLGMQVEWVVVPFNTSYKPGPKDFDFDINQISIRPAREEVVDFSDPYYQASQAVIAIKGTPIADAASIADLADYKLGAQTGTTSLEAIRDVIQPATEPAVFEDTNAAKQALINGQVDGILADLPTALYISAVEIPKSTLVGQFQAASGEQEEFGLLFEQGNELVTCVNEALAVIRGDGTLEQLEQQWLAESADIPVLQ